ncbi:MAG: hypothetical protein J7L47_04270 [Candidatus Odinarchaeota archaeon]|nr:hypothetical protein [Candidatus Odinarchaeota archaeon]
MNTKRIIVLSLVLMLALMSFINTPTKAAPVSVAEDSGAGKIIVATNGILMGNATYPYDYNATMIKNVNAYAVIDVDTFSNTGMAIVRYVTNGTEYTIIFKTFYQNETWQDGGIATNLMIGGTTNRVSSTLPNVYAYLYGFGNTTVYANNTKKYDNITGEFFYTVGFRNNTDYRVYNSTGNGLFNKSEPADVLIDPQDYELHVHVYDYANNISIYLFFENIVRYPTFVAVNGYKVGDYGDNFNYNGTNVKAINGYALVNVNATSDSGFVIANVQYGGNSYIFVMDNFSSNNGIRTNTTITGQAGISSHSIPAVHAYLIGVGWTDVFENNALVDYQFESEFFLSVGFTDDLTHAVYNDTKTGFFDPLHSSNVYIDPNDVEFHMIVHSNVQDLSNDPPYTKAYHLLFEDILYATLTIQLEIVAHQLDQVLAEIEQLIIEANSTNATSVVERLQKLKEKVITMRNSITAPNATIFTYVDYLEAKLNITETQLNNITQQLNETQQELDSIKAELKQTQDNLRETQRELEQTTDERDYYMKSKNDNLYVGFVVGIISGMVITVAALVVIGKVKSEQEEQAEK